MADKEFVRECFRDRFEETAEWRRAKAKQFPDDGRNLEAA